MNPDYDKRFGSKIMMTHYEPHTANSVRLLDIPKKYNVVNVASTSISGIFTFKPLNQTAKEFKDEVTKLNQAGRVVLLSIGCIRQGVKVQPSRLMNLTPEIIHLCDTYGFNGVILHLTSDDSEFDAQARVIPNALVAAREYYSVRDWHFYIGISPTLAHLHDFNPYRALCLASFLPFCDFIVPQLFLDEYDPDIGVYDAVDDFISVDCNERKQEFLYWITRALLTGEGGYVKIDSDSLVLGLPCSRKLVLGYVEEPADLLDALLDLRAQKYDSIRGLMGWKLNCDANNRYEFLKDYASYFSNK